MISAWELYLWTRLDILSGTGWGIIAFIGLAIGGLFWVACRIFDDNEAKAIKPFAKTACIIGGIMMFISCAMPSKKDAAMIWIVPQLATVENAELLKGEAAEIYKLAKQALTESLDINETQETK